MSTDSTQRFSSRVADYVRYRPGYPTAIVGDLVRAGMVRTESVVADIGSGTGLLSRIFLENGNRVIGVEPNADMRRAGEEQLASFERFSNRDGTAEATGLGDSSVDLVVAGQAFHWFDRARAIAEFGRILRHPAWMALIWNERKVDGSPFLVDYERLAQAFGTDYSHVDHRNLTDEAIRAVFAPSPVTLSSYENRQVFDFPGLRGRLLSSSYAPGPGHPHHEPMLRGLREIFDAHQQAGEVTVEYTTRVFAGALPSTTA